MSGLQGPFDRRPANAPSGQVRLRVPTLRRVFTQRDLERARRLPGRHCDRRAGESPPPATTAPNRRAAASRRIQLPGAGREQLAADASRALDNLILWLGRTLEAPGHSIGVWSVNHRAIVGALTDANLRWLLIHARDTGLLTGDISQGARGPHDVSLSFDGWRRREELRRERRDSRTGFMAMPFGQPGLDLVFAAFRRGAKVAGFELFRVDEDPPAGLIDDRLGVEMRMARFLVADLTHENAGAYWEAGFAEGLGVGRSSIPASGRSSTSGAPISTRVITTP